MMYLQSFLALFLVLGLVGVFYIIAQRLNGRVLSVAQSSRLIKVVESTSLGEKRNLVLIQVDGQFFLVGATPQNVSLVSAVTISSDSLKSAQKGPKKLFFKSRRETR